jgi:hypothetical protein
MTPSFLHSLVLFHIALITANHVTPADRSIQNQPSVSGTYKLAICKRQPCSPDDAANTVVTGMISLSDSNYTLTAFPDSVRFIRQHRDARVRRNGCSVTTKTGAAPATFAALGGMELISWTRDASGRVSFALHEEVGADYRVSLEVTGDRVRGTGRSVGAHGKAPAYPDDIIVGVKAGAADHRFCADSAMTWLRNAKK